MTLPVGIALRRLAETDDFRAFESDEGDLNDFVRDDARRLEARDATRVYVALSGASPVGYIAVLTDTIILQQRERKRLDLTSQDSKSVPAVKVGRLAVDKRFQRNGIGEALMGLAYQLAVGVRRSLGCRLLTVDSLPRSELFYTKLGFKRNRAAPEEETCPLCDKPLNTCPHCGGVIQTASPRITISMHFDLKADPLPPWAADPLATRR